VAHNLAALGSKVGFISKIGDDPLGQIALDRLENSGVDISKVKRSTGATKTGLTVLLQRAGWRNILTYPGTIFELMFEDLDISYLADARHFHLSSFYLQRGLQPRVIQLFKRLKAAGLTISLDTNDDPDEKWGGGLLDVLPYVDVFLPNEREAKGVTSTDDVDEALAKLADLVPTVVLKMGTAGAMAKCGSETVKVPAIRVDVVDAIGAGDSFDAGFIHEFVRGSDLATCVATGNVTGALSTTRPGGTEAFRNREDREEFLRKMRAKG